MDGHVAGAQDLNKEISMIQDTSVPEHDMPTMPMREILNRSSSSLQDTQTQLRVQAAMDKEIADNVENVKAVKKKRGGTTEEPGQPRVTAGMEKDTIAARAQAERLVAAHQVKLHAMQERSCSV